MRIYPSYENNYFKLENEKTTYQVMTEQYTHTYTQSESS